ncbi:RNA polymerase sigma factor RpoD/SigA [Prevotella brunnea]|uniref:sigma-70 family RNA polymerase sigma factor n=1 Tax=Prevotella brunnea TaxID=2508867 RepID=UPI00281892D8|nr:RNA polymerase sigma factor RpoD/SigA [Prevotella brunnea]MDR0185662.1 RNA polymerase sigma factor RpoD/SigA [Prevotella brunnea]
MRQLKITQMITNRNGSSLDRYLQEIGHQDLISTDEEVELAQRIKRGDQKALEKLTKANLRFVVSVAKQYQNNGLSLLDLINEGNLGLIKAAKKFDETRGFKFISYAVWWIRQSIMQAIADQSRLVRIPINQSGTVKRIQKAYDKFEQENGRMPSVDEIADDINLPQDKVEEAMNVEHSHISIDAPLNSDGTKLIDVLPNKNLLPTDIQLIEEGLYKEIKRALQRLTLKEQIIVKAFYGIDQKEMSLEEIGEKTNLTRERVRQIKEKAISKLRTNNSSEELKSYLGQ